jgi:hypothetical protein
MEKNPQILPDPPRPKLVLAALFVLVNRFLLRIGIRKPIDGWRCGATIALAQEPAKFVLSSFGLNATSDAPNVNGLSPDQIHCHITRRLDAFLERDKQFFLCIEPGECKARILATDGPSYTFRFEPWVDGPRRFIRPDDWTGKSPSAVPDGTLPLFEFVIRVSADLGADVWVRINHAAMDGTPVQEMLGRLEKVWGIKSPTVFPDPESFEACTAPRPSPGRDGIVEVQTFLDFSPLLAWRKRQNEKLCEPMMLSAAIMWWLNKVPEFSRSRIGTTIDMPEIKMGSKRLDRGVGMIVFRPADYFDLPDGLARYVEDFNREVAQTRQRKTRHCRTVDAAAYIPPVLLKAILCHGLSRKHRAFGKMGITIIRDAKVFGAPLGDCGHPGGFIAIGDVSLPSENGTRVGCVHVKGPECVITKYAALIREAINLAGAETTSVADQTTTSDSAPVVAQ